jgi:hypothetical protein
MTNPEASLKRLEEEIELQLCDAANLEGDFEADDPNAGVYTATVARHRQIASDLRTLLTSYRAQAALLEEAEARLKANEWELADYAKTVGKLRGDVLTCPSCGYATTAERFR